MAKHFKIAASDIKPIAEGRGYGIASDRIVVDGAPVGFMYRTASSEPADSGWAFFAGDESEDYMDDPSDHTIYDLNTIANYDPDVVTLLDAPAGTAFIRTPSGLVPDPEGAPPD